MGRLLTLRLDDEVLEALEATAAQAGFRVQRTSTTELLEALERSPTGEGGRVDGVALGGVEQPLRIVQRVRVSVPAIPVVLVRSAEECESLRQALRFSPYGAPDVECVPSRPADKAVDAIRLALERGAKKRRLRRTLTGLNPQLADSAGTRRLKAAAGMLSQLMDVAPTGIALTNPDGVLLDVNPRAVQLLGRNKPRLVGTPVWGAFPRAEQDRMRGLLATLDEDHASQPRALLRRAGPDGPRHIEVSGARLDRASGGPGYMVILQDVTERVQLVEQLRRSNRRKDEFLAMLSHELRNPLAPIRTATELLRMRDDPSMERELSIIERHVGHLVELVDDLLDVARITRGRLALRRETVDVSSFVRQAVEMTTPLLEERRLELSVSSIPQPLKVEGDARRLAQVTANLLSNAAKHTEPGGVVEVGVAREGDAAVIRVTDSGSGIDPELLPQIFEMFVQKPQELDRKGGGLGLGLAIVRSLVESHGGRVKVESEVGHGSTFTVTLPLSDGAEAEPPQDSASDPSPAEANAERVLVVDDNEDAAFLVAHLVRSMGYRAEVAYDAPSALALAERDAPDVALLDIGLPVVDGYELGQRLRGLEGLEDLPLVAVTGYGQRSDVDRSREAGFAVHLVKPVTKAQLRDAITQALATAR